MDPGGQLPGPASNIPLAKRLGGRSDRQEVVGNRLSMIGSVELQPPNSMVKFLADQVDIYFDDNRLVARGNVVFSDLNGRIAAERVEFDLSTGTGVFHDASGIMAMGQFANPSQFAGQDPDVYFYGERDREAPQPEVPHHQGRVHHVRAADAPVGADERQRGHHPRRLRDRRAARCCGSKACRCSTCRSIYYPLQDERARHRDSCCRPTAPPPFAARR